MIRKNCVICKGSITFLKKFSEFPLYMGVSENENFEFCDMTWAKCNTCGCVQLSELIDPEVLYKIPHNPAVGKTWELHNLTFSDVVTSYSPRNVLDVGGANLRLANLISVDKNVERYDVIDFSANKYEIKKMSEKINLITCSAETYARENSVDCIILSHTLEHLYEPVSFLQNIKPCLTKNGKIFISVPNIKNQLIDGFLNALHFEHTYFIDHEYLEMIGNLAGFELVQKVDFSKYNSFYVFSPHEKTQNLHTSPHVASDIFCKFSDDLHKDVTSINEITKGLQFYVFGAHVFTQYLIKAGLKIDRIAGIIDNDTNKIGKFLYGTSIRVSGPNVVKGIDTPTVLLRVAQYKKEIADQLIDINNSVRFI